MTKNTTYVLVTVALLLLVGVGVYAFTSDADDTKPLTPTTSSDSGSQTSTETKSNTPATSTSSENVSTATITFDGNTFSPSTITVKSGTTITLNNTSNVPVELSSADHPSHRDNPELNMRTVSPRSSGTLTVTKTGTWGYHDHIDASKTGTIIVQ